MKIAIIGYGAEGRSLHAYFAGKGHDVTVCDVKKPENIEKSSVKKFRFGPGYLNGLNEFEMIFRSPGIPYLKKEFTAVRGKITGLTGYFFEKCPCPIIGVTGTKGKGTTSALAYEMLKRWGKKNVFIGGNMGHSPLNFLDKLKKDDLAVLELSSFQLQDLNKSPHVAVVLGITPDHLDHHADFEEYAGAKKNIVRFQSAKDVAILDADNEISAGFKAFTKANVHMISISAPVKRGAFMKAGSFVIKEEKTGTIFGERGQTGLIGPHNISNIFAAAVAAKVIGVPVEVITAVTREFRGLPHRLELVREIAGVKFYNDSASTNPQTAIAALRSFDAPLTIILGGSDKNTDFTPLGEEIAARFNVKRVIVMGQTRSKIEAAIEAAVAKKEAQTKKRGVPLELITSETYQEAFMVARMLASPGDTILLSPACASFDMFANYTERGEIFRNFVMEMA